MSQHAAAAASSPWATADGQSHAELRSPEDHHREVLNKTYQKALAALASAQAVVAGVASGLYDVEASQTDVSARLSGRSVTRFTGRKRKLSPSVYDYSDSCFAGAPGKADTPTQELLPASRSELRSHQLQAVRWLASLESQGAGGVLADESEQDRRGAVAGLLSHLLLVTPPNPTAALEPLQPPPAGVGHAASVGVGGAQVCMLLAPGCSLGGWAEAISEHVDVAVHMYDGTAGSAAALQAACAGPANRGAHPHPHPHAHPHALAGLAPLAQQPAPAPPLSAGRRGATGGAHPHPHGHSLLGTSSSSSTAGVNPPNRHPQPSAAAAAAATAASPLLRHAGGGGSAQHKSLVVVLSPLEHLHRDAALLSQIPQRLLVVDLAPGGGGGGGTMRFSGGVHSGGDSGGGAAAGSSNGGGGDLFGAFGCGGRGGFGASSEPGSGSGSGANQSGRLRQGMALEAYHHLHLLNRMPAASRVLLSAGAPEPSGDGIWLLLQLLAPKVHRPLWEAVCELQQGLVASGPVGAQCKEAVLSEVHGRLWGLLRPLTLHRRARDVDLSTMRAATTNLNLYDHFSAARAEGA